MLSGIYIGIQDDILRDEFTPRFQVDNDWLAFVVVERKLFVNLFGRTGLNFGMTILQKRIAIVKLSLI